MTDSNTLIRKAVVSLDLIYDVFVRLDVEIRDLRPEKNKTIKCKIIHYTLFEYYNMNLTRAMTIPAIRSRILGLGICLSCKSTPFQKARA